MRVKAALRIAAIVAIEFAIAIAAVPLATTLCRGDASAPSSSAAGDRRHGRVAHGRR